jgi:phosphatidylserine/phosphatidylglycerophosphate/cardiolipin synthase-like enzyme
MRLPPLLLSLAALGAAIPAHADFLIPGFELVLTTPVETTLANSDLRDPVTVWSQLFDNARHEIVIGQFYAAGKAGTPFEKVIERLEAAGKRGVKIRFLLDTKGIGLSEPATLARLRAIPNLEMRILDYSKLTGNGIIHAKYLIVDKQGSLVGSQNFDWRSFKHIHETGLLIGDPPVVAQVQAIFEQDWQAQALLAANQPVPKPLPQAAGALASPAGAAGGQPGRLQPARRGRFRSRAAALLAEATDRGARADARLRAAQLRPGPHAPYYAVIDNALRAAAARGVTVKLMVSNWNTEKPAIALPEKPGAAAEHRDPHRHLAAGRKRLRFPSRA